MMSGGSDAGGATGAPVPVYSISGVGAELGRQHGRLLGAPIRAFLRDDLARLNRLVDEPFTVAGLEPQLQAYDKAIARELPTLHDEVVGLAQGAEIPVERALLLQLRRELVGYRSVPARGDCTTFARVGQHDAVLAQTVDLNGDLEREAYVLQISGAGRDGRSLLLLTFTGLLGYLGINSHGLAIGLNLVLGGSWRPGIPGYMAIRHLLETARSVEDCVGLVERIDWASSRSLTFCDPSTAATVEILDNQCRWRTSGELVHTNHYRVPEFRARDELNVFARNGSVARFDACSRALAALPPKASTADYFSVLDRAPVCVPPDGNVRREVTVARVVMKPRTLELVVKRGAHPWVTAQSFRMRARP